MSVDIGSVILIVSGQESYMKDWLAGRKAKAYRIAPQNVGGTRVLNAFFDANIDMAGVNSIPASIEEFLKKIPYEDAGREISAFIDVAINIDCNKGSSSLRIGPDIASVLVGFGIELNLSLYPTADEEGKHSTSA